MANNSIETPEISFMLGRQMNTSTPLRLGLLGVGLVTYWPQFKEVKDRLLGYQSRMRKRLGEDDQ